MRDATQNLVPARLLVAPRASLAERLVEQRLKHLADGVLEIETEDRLLRFGHPTADGLAARLTVLDQSLFWRVLLGGTLGASEAFMDGAWTADDLTKLIRLFVRNGDLLEHFELGTSRLGNLIAGLQHLKRKNTRAGSRRNIADHYDLGNDFFQLMLDPSMTYSAAIFERPTSTLEEASLHKLDLLCRKLELTPGNHLLEIGTGWGSLAVHAASRYGCRVTTTTISREQHALAAARVKELGLAERITVLNTDYRELEGRFDKIVSCEMIEAVGREFYPLFFRKCDRLLGPNGKLVLQVITIRDQRFERASREVEFIKRYIFPGSCMPSTTALLQAATESSALTLQRFEDYTLHYARTMTEWRKNLAPHKAKVVERFGDRFWRMWDYYLAYCEAGFQERYIASVQLVFARPRAES
ncbi:MAG: class I SAM-dependent methyltransferase [Myxococcaceae bacterium]